MRDNLANRGRVKYDDYTAEERNGIKQLTMQYLNGEIDEIQQMDSLKMIKEIFF